MPDYQKMYLTLFAATEDVLELPEHDRAAFRKSFLPVRIKARLTQALTQAQLQCEALYVEDDTQKG